MPCYRPKKYLEIRIPVRRFAKFVLHTVQYVYVHCYCVTDLCACFVYAASNFVNFYTKLCFCISVVTLSLIIRCYV